MTISRFTPAVSVVALSLLATLLAGGETSPGAVDGPPVSLSGRDCSEMVSERHPAAKDQIPVTATWADLLGQEPHLLGHGVSLRLGIEALRCPRWAGILLYAYTEGFDDRQRVEANRDRVGPVGPNRATASTSS
jgi:hypothetical protein